MRVTSKGIVARVGGINDRNSAEPLRGTKLYIERSKLPETSGAEFYHADLIGLRAIAGDDSVLGQIVSVQNFGAGDLLELKPHDGTETESFLLKTAGCRTSISSPAQSSSTGLPKRPMTIRHHPTKTTVPKRPDI